MKKISSTAVRTRQRILEAAGEVFAEAGFRTATVREICKRAGVNIAAVNYHFGDKERLYVAVLKYCKTVAFEKYPADEGVGESDPPEKRLRVFIRAMLWRILDADHASMFPKLVVREYIEPTPALDMWVDEAIRPMFQLLSNIVESLLGKGASEAIVRMCCTSVVSQCLHFAYARPVMKRLFGQESFGKWDIEIIADHIAAFSLHAIRGLAAGQEKGGTG
ncbi:MAG: HTH-type transcriptional repressor NicS [Syntrophorhabdus sp. PtaU1.Bin153]|nr:MAG: HTH-type transcriptional repressor NicS [Syntrophorhabdus sp. PtaU1.Bin153]